MKTFNEKEVEIIKLALKVLINTLDGKNDASASILDACDARFRGYAEELFASIHSQGG
ncbi:MAG: hypothetical protein Ta2B_12880 [Termitinemataceae bacterium]|nr:MAG: hypothetical protein Ta2B_12880 [Termitinemataceae bacterium]